MFVVFAVGCASAPTPSATVEAAAIRQTEPTPDRQVSYRSFTGRDFPIFVFDAEGASDPSTPAIVMYHGGGWRAGTPDQFYRFAEVWNQLGVTVLLPVYALERTHDATVWQSLEDAFLSWQAIHEAAEELGLDPDAMAAGGGSAGGHLAAALATLDPPASVSDHVRPAALLLFNPVIDNSPDGYGADRIGPEWERFSPLHNIEPTHPPTLFMLGDRDRLIPVETGAAYCDAVRASGADCSLKIYPEAEHGWFNRTGFTDTLRHSTTFLAAVFALEPLFFSDTRAVDAFLLVQDGEGDYAPIAEGMSYEAPPSHSAGGPLFRYQGPVVEGPTFGVRAYFDERARFDVFNKTAPELVLREARNDYHSEADWGRDTLFVGQSLGFATPAIVTAQGLEPAARVDRRRVRVHASDAVARFVLEYENWSVGEAVRDASHSVVMRQGTDYVEHTVTFDGAPPGPLVAGIVRHEAGEMRTGQVGQVAYLLTYGPQSDRDRGLGMAMIYPAPVAGGQVPHDELSHLALLTIDEETHSAQYWATADWAGDPDFAPDIDAFEAKVGSLASEAAQTWFPPEQR